jgi:hypothetical protein
MSRWFRLYDDTINDPKILKLPEVLRWYWIALLCVASKCGGNLPPLDDIAIQLRVTQAKATEVLASLVKAGLLDRTETGFVPHNWHGRQYKSDVSTDRVKRFRNGKRNVSETAGETQDETFQKRHQKTEAEAETDSEAIASGADAPRKRIGGRFDEFWAAYPRRDGPNPRKPAEQRFASLVKSGLDPGMMIEAAQKLAADETARGNVGTRFIPQAVTWLNQQRWADHSAVVELQQQQAAANLAPKIHVKADTSQWRAWAAYLGTPPPLDRNFGWHFDSEWPPDHMQATG